MTFEQAERRAGLPGKYRKKPVVIEAMLFRGDMGSALKVQEWIGKKLDTRWASTGDSGYLLIPTLEGEMMALGGDYIIKGVKGEFYPCKPDIFEETYESA